MHHCAEIEFATAVWFTDEVACVAPDGPDGLLVALNSTMRGGQLSKMKNSDVDELYIQEEIDSLYMREVDSTQCHAGRDMRRALRVPMEIAAELAAGRQTPGNPTRCLPPGVALVRASGTWCAAPQKGPMPRSTWLWDRDLR